MERLIKGTPFIEGGTVSKKPRIDTHVSPFYFAQVAGALPGLAQGLVGPLKNLGVGAKAEAKAYEIESRGKVQLMAAQVGLNKTWLTVGIAGVVIIIVAVIVFGKKK